MRPTPEELAAYADGELSGEREHEVAAAVEADPALAEEVERHRALRRKLAAHFAPILEQPVPDSLSEAVRPAASSVVELATVRAVRQRRKSLPRWSYLAGPALAACLVLAIFVNGGGGTPQGYADKQLASVLDNQLVAGQGAAPTRILLSFRDHADRYCRAFAGTAQSGIACRDDKGWKLEETGSGAASPASAYRQAGTDEAALMAAAQDMANGSALDAEQERKARADRWRVE